MIRLFRQWRENVADASWQQGYETATAEAEVAIGEQAEIIDRLMKVVDLAGGWDHVPPDLWEQLRDYCIPPG